MYLHIDMKFFLNMNMLLMIVMDQDHHGPMLPPAAGSLKARCQRCQVSRIGAVIVLPEGSGPEGLFKNPPFGDGPYCTNLCNPLLAIIGMTYSWVYHISIRISHLTTLL